MNRRYVLFTSGDRFGRLVLGELEALGKPPDFIAVPWYPGAIADSSRQLPVESRPRPDWLARWPDSSLLHVPREQQSRGADRLRALRCAFMLVACWPWRIDGELISAPSAAALNLHPSLLPRFRGANPLAAQLAAGDSRFGVSLHLLARRLDAGDIIARQAVPAIDPRDDIENLELACARQGARLFVDAIERYPRWTPRRQDEQGD